jgi:hypothetical protein
MTDLGVTVTDSLGPGSTFGGHNAWLRRLFPLGAQLAQIGGNLASEGGPYLVSGPVSGRSRLHEYARLPGIGNVRSCCCPGVVGTAISPGGSANPSVPAGAGWPVSQAWRDGRFTRA